jgi:general L-amino acid transport system permease protein
MTDVSASDSPESLLATQQQRPPLYRDATVVKWVAQIVTLVLVIATAVFFANQAGSNLRAKSISVDYDFLSINPGFQVGEGIDVRPDTGGRALWVGMVNTLRLAFAGIILSTILGVVIGVSRLSKNWIANRVASTYIETIRNIPLLVQMLIVLVVLQSLGRLTDETGPFGGWLYVSVKGISLPRIFASDGFYQWAVFLIIGFFLGRWAYRKRVATREATGEDTKAGWVGFGVFMLVALIGWFAHPIFGFIGPIFDAVADVIDAIPQLVVQVILGLTAVAAALLWVRRFLDSRRTPAGLAKLTDDDYFRMIFAAVGGLFGALFFLVLWPGFSAWLLSSGSDLFTVLGDKFGDGRTGQPVDAMRPSIIGDNIKSYGPGGLSMSVGFTAVFIGVTLYTAAFIAEIVRGGILAVPKGQTEAASAIGLSRSQLLRFVILPQAFRVSLPPLGNQYLNLTKNTSLAVAVGYADVVNIGNTVINQSGRALSVFSIWMLFYLACSLSTSVVVNFFNVRLKIVER